MVNREPRPFTLIEVQQSSGYWVCSFRRGSQNVSKKISKFISDEAIESIGRPGGDGHYGTGVRR
jgi:hypothetical protein